jgi:hypothetical protein
VPRNLFHCPNCQAVVVLMLGVLQTCLRPPALSSLASLYHARLMRQLRAQFHAVCFPQPVCVQGAGV